MSRPADLRARRHLYNGFGDTLARAFELVIAPVVLAFLGHVVDGRLGTGYALAIGLGVFGVVGTFAKMWLQYTADMQRHEAELRTRPRSVTQHWDDGPVLSHRTESAAAK